MGFFSGIVRKAKSVGSGLVRKAQDVGRSVGSFVSKAATKAGQIIDKAAPIASDILGGVETAGKAISDYAGDIPVVGDIAATAGKYLGKAAGAGRKALESGTKYAKRGIDIGHEVGDKISTGSDRLEPQFFKHKF